MSDSELDFDHLNQYVGGDVDLTKELFGLFQNQIDIWGKALSVDTDDEIFQNAAHALKGSAQAIGALRLASLCQKAETMAEQKIKGGQRAAIIQDLEFTISRVVAEIKRWEHRQMIKDLG